MLFLCVWEVFLCGWILINVYRVQSVRQLLDWKCVAVFVELIQNMCLRSICVFVLCMRPFAEGCCLYVFVTFNFTIESSDRLHWLVLQASAHPVAICLHAQAPAQHAKKIRVPTRACVFSSGRASAVTAVWRHLVDHCVMTVGFQLLLS